MKSVNSDSSKKTIYFFAITLGVVMLFASCDQNETIENIDTSVTTDYTEVRFTGTIAQQAILDNTGTRMAGIEWAEGDAIGIFMTDFNASNKIQTVENKKYMAIGNDTFQPVQGDELYYPVDGTKVSFVAYYPFMEEMEYLGHARVTVETKQTTENQQEFDLLYASNREGYDKTSAAVDLQFFHQLSKIVIKIVQPSTLNPNSTGITDNDLKGMDITIIGINTVGLFYIEFGSLSNEDILDNITPRTITDGVEYDAIIIPCSYNDDKRIKVTFTLKSGETFTWSLPDSSFIKGNQYNYTVAISRHNGVDVVASISDWEVNNMDGIYYAEESS